MSPVVVPLFRSHHEIIGIAEDGPRKSPSPFQKAMGKALSFIHALVDNKYQTLPKFCKMKNISYFFIKDMRNQLFENWVLAQKPDLIVVCSMSHLLKRTIFSIPKHGTINLHPSYLPAYRGPNPYLWMYYNMDLTGGVTVHYINEGEDTGDIIFQEKIPVALGTSLHQLRIHLIDEIGTQLLLRAVDAIENGTAPRIPQSKKSPTLRARNLSNGEERTLVDWNLWEVKRVWNIVNGYFGIYDFIGYNDHPPRGYKPVVQKFIECTVQQKDIGKIGINTDGSKYITCINGKIVYRFQYDLPRRVHNILKIFKPSK
jgi:methionyl-tRNA formyltransferase